MQYMKPALLVFLLGSYLLDMLQYVRFFPMFIVTTYRKYESDSWFSEVKLAERHGPAIEE